MSAVDKLEGSLRCPQKLSADAPIEVGSMVEPKVYVVMEVHSEKACLERAKRI
jgi:hypothetical protein